MNLLTDQQRLILELLSRRQSVAVEQIIDHLWGAVPECDLPDDPQTVVTVQVCKLRKAVAPFGIEIVSLIASPTRYQIHRDSREKVRYVLDHFWALAFKDDANQLELFAHG